MTAREERIRQELHGLAVPGEDAAEARSWDVVKAAFEEGAPAARSRRRSRASVLAGGLLAATAALGLALTPAGAAVSEWVRSAVDGTSTATKERPALTHVPSGGRLLVGTGAGQWVVAEDGSRRFLGDFAGAAWSPGGLFVAAADGTSLTAVSPDGKVQWSVPTPGQVEDPAWAPGCCRVAYRVEGKHLVDGEIRVVDGAGNFDHRLAPRTAAVAPAWRPARYDLEAQGARNVLAYVDLDGRLTVVDVDSGRRLAKLLVGRPTSIHWLSRDRILIASQDRIQVADIVSGEIETVYRPPRSAGAIVSVDTQPGGSLAAALIAQGTSRFSPEAERSRLVLLGTRPGPDPGGSRTAFSGLGRYDGPLFSPDGSQVQLGWRDAGQWLFVPTDPDADVIAVDNIPRQFGSTGAGRSDPLPRIESWCCR